MRCINEAYRYNQQSDSLRTEMELLKDIHYRINKNACRSNCDYITVSIWVHAFGGVVNQ